MYNIYSHINVKFFSKKLPGEAGNVPLVKYMEGYYSTGDYNESELWLWEH